MTRFGLLEESIVETQTQTGSHIKTSLGHLKHHVKYPADRNTVVQACNNMSDVEKADREWFTTNLPQGTYKGPADVLNALLTKV